MKSTLCSEALTGFPFFHSTSNIPASSFHIPTNENLYQGHYTNL